MAGEHSAVSAAPEGLGYLIKLTFGWLSQPDTLVSPEEQLHILQLSQLLQPKGLSCQLELTFGWLRQPDTLVSPEE